MRKFEELLPIGSVVRLKDSRKKIVVIGIMSIVRVKENTHVAYDYMGVFYPEGFINLEKSLLFMHEDISEVVFEGYADKERGLYIDALAELIAETDSIVNDAVKQPT